MGLTFDDCVGLCDLSEAEILAIAAHEHLPALAALELGSYLVRSPDGEQRVKEIIRDDLAAAASSGDRPRMLALKSVLRDYILNHPRCESRHCRALVANERRAASS
jgi:hypothetical protein